MTTRAGRIAWISAIPANSDVWPAPLRAAMRARMAAASSVRSVRGRSSGSHPAQRRLARHSARGWAHISAQWESRRRWIIIVMAAPLGIGDDPSPSTGRCPRCCLPGSGCCPCDAQCCPSSRECCPVGVTTRLPTKRTGRAPKDTAGRRHADRAVETLTRLPTPQWGQPWRRVGPGGPRRGKPPPSRLR